MNPILIIAICGFLVSFYDLYLKRKIDQNKDYKAVCDLNDRFSCTKVIVSEYGNTLGIPNAVWGLIFYSTVGALAYLEKLMLVWYLAIAGIIASIYLAYILYTKIKTVCLVCTTIYIINILLLISSYYQVFAS